MKSQRGFTIVELILAVSISSVIAATLLTISLRYTGEMLRARITADLAIESQILLRSIVDDTRLADSLSSSNSNTDANAPNGGWVTSDPSNVLIIDSPAINSSRDIIYNTSTSLPYSNEVVYYSSGTTMYRRSIKNTAASGNSMVTSCPPSLATNSCPADKLFTKYLKDLTFTFYDDTDATTANATLARSVKITVTTERKINGKTVTFANSIRTTMRNR
jgi:prepilin-type N-terminal cleavage/methylation domain-containing protein